MNIKAVIFDLDYTLFDRALAQKKIIKKIYKDQKKFFKNKSFKEVQSAFLKSSEEADRQFKFINQEAFRKGRSKLFLNYLDIDSKYTDFFCDIYIEYYTSVYAPFKGVKRIIKKLWKKYALAVITNGFPDVQYGKIESLGLLGYFDIITLSAEFGHEKPDEKIFLHTCNELDIKTGEAIYIGDSLNADIYGANNVGMLSCLFDPDKKFNIHENNIKPDFIIHKISDLIKKVKL